MRTKKIGQQTKTLVLEVATQGIMGVALGLTFAFMAILIPETGVSALMAKSPDPILRFFVWTCASTFGLGAAFTGLLLKMTQDN